MMKIFFCALLLTIGPIASARADALSHDLQTKAVANTPCDTEDAIDSYWSANPLLCTSGRWHNAVVSKTSNGEDKPFTYNGKCALRLSTENRNENSVTVQVGKLLDICLPAGWQTHLIAIAESDDFYISHPPLITNLVLLKPTKRTRTRVWIYPVGTNDAHEEKFQIMVDVIE